jgi:hypothetical protein
MFASAMTLAWAALAVQLESWQSAFALGHRRSAMFTLSRRTFLGASVAGLAAAPLLADDRSLLEKLKEESPDAPSTLFLTWQRDPTTTMTIQWLGRAADGVDTRIRFRASDAAKSDADGVQEAVARPYPRSDFTLFRAELTGLRSGVDYEFRIGTQSVTRRFATMPAKATKAIHFVSGGDCGVNGHAVANNIQAARQDPSFAVIGGDIAYDDGWSLGINLGFLANYSQHMVASNGRLIPLVPCIGNHEVVGGYGTSRERAPFFYALFDGLFPEHGHAALDFGDYLSLVLLDTGHTTKIDGEQTDWLDKTLAARADLPHVMVVNHVPAYPSHRKMETGAPNRKHWVPLFEKHRVPVVLEHHDHTFKRTKPLLDGLAHDNGVLYLGDGSWGHLRTPHTPEELPIFAASSEDYHLSLHRLEGDERFHRALNENGKVMDICHSGQRTKGVVAVPN